MKKLMVILSVALSLGAFAEDLPTGVSFESFGAGAFDFSKKDDNTAVSGAGDLAYWITNTVEEAAEIKEESGRYTQSDAPAQWAKAASNEKYLHLDSALVYRTAKTCIDEYGDRRTIAGQADDATVSFDDKAKGIFFDSMVKFTAFEELQTSLADNEAKLAVYAYAPDDGTTNLVISGAYVNGNDRTLTNYVSSAAINIDAWHRLTVRAFNAGGSENQPAFLVYLDGALVANDDWDCGLTTEDLSALGAEYIAGGKYGNGLIPSMSTSFSLCAMGISGSGDIDDISITDVKPTFINEDKAYTVAWNEGVKTLKIDSAEAFDVPSASGTTNLTLGAGVTEVTIVATYSNNYERGTWSATGGATAPAAPDNKFTGVTAGDVLTINAMLPKYDIGGSHYATFEEAFNAAASGATIKMMANDVFGTAFTIPTGKSIIVDLAGKKLSSDEGESVFVVYGGSLVVTNSTVEIGEIVTDSNAIYVGKDEQDPPTAGYAAVYGGKFSGAIQEDGGTLELYAGIFLDPNYDPEDPDVFYLAENVQGGATITNLENGYFQVGGEPPAPTTATLTIPTLNNVTVSASTGSVEIATAAGDYTVEIGAEVAVTWTATGSYVFGNMTQTTNETVTVGAEGATLVEPATQEAEAKKGSVFFLTLQDALDDAAAETITLLADGTINDTTKAETIALGGKNLTLAGDTLTNDLTIAGAAGTVIASGNKAINGVTLDLSGIAYSQVSATGKFVIDATGKVIMPVGASYPDMTLAVDTANSADGAKIATSTGTTYTWGNSVWAQGEAIAVAKIGSTGYATIKAALEAADFGDTVTFLANVAVADRITTAVTTKAATIDFNGKSVALTEAALTFATDANKAAITITGGEDLWYKNRTISIPAGVDFTIDGMTYYGQITPKGADNAVVTICNSTFSNKYNKNGTEDAGAGVANAAYESYNVSAGGLKCTTLKVYGNTFMPMIRSSFSFTDTTFANTVVYIYNNEFDCSKNCHNDDASKRYPAVAQLYYAKAAYIENNTFSGAYATAGAFAAKAYSGYDVDIICRGNTFDENVKYIWVNHDKGTLTGKILFGDNVTNSAVNTVSGQYGTVETDANKNNPYGETVAAPATYGSFFALAESDDAGKYCVNGAYVDSLADLVGGETLIADPEQAVTGLPSTLALENVDDYVNKWTVIVKPTELTVDVTLGAGVASVTYDSTVYTESFQIKNVAPNAELTFSALTLSGDQYSEKVAVTGDLTGGKVESAYVYTVAAELTNPNATITFNTETAYAVAYTVEGDTFVKRCDTVSNAQVEAKVEGQYVKFFKGYNGSSEPEQLSFKSDTVMRIDFNGQTLISRNSQVAAYVEGTKFNTYYGYTVAYQFADSLTAAFTAKGSTAKYLLSGDGANQISVTNSVTLTASATTFEGVIWKTYSGTIQPLKDDPAIAADCARTATWGQDTTAHTFKFVAEAAGPTPISPDVPQDVPAASEEEAIGKVKVAIPEAAKSSGVDADVYDGYFTKKAVEKTTGTWTVTATLSDDIIKAEDETVEIADQLTTFEDGFTLDAGKVKPGLYYSLKAGNSVTGREEGNRVLATADEDLELPAEKYEGSGFYQILVNTAPKAE